MIINYYLTNAPTPAITAYTTAMKNFGITFLPDVSGFYTGNSMVSRPVSPNSSEPMIRFTLTSDYVSALSSDPGVVGYYVQDEPAISCSRRPSTSIRLIKAADPSGFTYAVLDHPLDLLLWKDTVDVLGVDAVPDRRRDSGNDLAEVADRTRAAYQAGHGARPVWTVIQFFQANLESAWPTQQQLHDMSWMAIVEGASGLFYWEYGVRGLYEVKDPVEHAALYQELINVTTEIKSLEPVLLSPDAAGDHRELRAGHRLHQDQDRQRRHPLPVRVQLHRVAGHRRVHAGTARQPASSTMTPESSTAPDTSTTFSGAFQPYQAHIFLDQQFRAGLDAHSKRDSNAPTTPSPTGTPPPTSTTATSTATATRHRDADSRTATTTATATPTATAPHADRHSDRDADIDQRPQLRLLLRLRRRRPHRARCQSRRRA